MRWGFFTKFDALAHGVPCLLSLYKPVLILSTSCSTQPPVKQFFIGQITTGMRIKVKTLTLVQYCTKMHFSKFCPMTIFENITCSQWLNLQFQVVYDQNHHFGLGLIPKPKEADTFGRYPNWYRNHIFKEESCYCLILL